MRRPCVYKLREQAAAYVLSEDNNEFATDLVHNLVGLGIVKSLDREVVPVRVRVGLLAVKQLVL